MRVALAFTAAAAAALATLMLFVLALWPFSESSEPAWRGALHFGLYGGVIIFGATVLLAVPSYLLLRALGRITWASSFIGGVGIALGYPLLVTYENFPSDVVQWWAYAVCGICGAVAAMVFCRVADIQRGLSQVQPRAQPRR